MYLSNDFDEIMTHLGEDCPRSDGYHVLLKLLVPAEFYKNEEGTQTEIVIPQEFREKTIYTCMTGLVLNFGPDCYKPEKFKNWNKREIGDWVIFRPNEGTLFYCKGVPLRFVPEEHIFGKVSDPFAISRT